LRKKTFSKHTYGFSLVELLVFTGIATVLMYATMTLIFNMSKGLRTVRIQDSFNDFNDEIKKVLEDSITCKANLQGLTFNPAAIGTTVNINSLRYYDPTTAALGTTLVGPMPYAVPNTNGLRISRLQLVSFQTSPTLGRYFAKLRVTADKDGVFGSSSSSYEMGMILVTTPAGPPNRAISECFIADPVKLGRTFSKTFNTIKVIPYPAPHQNDTTMAAPGVLFPAATSNPEVEITELRQTINLPRAAFATAQIKLNVFSSLNPRDYHFRLRLGGVTGTLYDKSIFNGLVSRTIGGTVYLSWSGEMPAGVHVFVVTAEAIPPVYLTSVTHYSNPTATNPAPDNHEFFLPKAGLACFITKSCIPNAGYTWSDCTDFSASPPKCDCKSACVHGEAGGNNKAWPTVRINACSKSIYKIQGTCADPSPLVSSSVITVFGEATGT
jgi:type II secretory pathway pseudopilin PulG